MPEQRPILVVDDERHVRSALSRVLRRIELDPAEAASGEEALAALAARRFACALVDLRMPGMSGMELVRRARAADPALPIVVVTGHGDLEDAKRAAHLGVSDFVMKPWDNAELQVTVLRALQGRAAPQPEAPAGTPPRPETLRAGMRACDALRTGPLPARFAPPLGFANGDFLGGAGAFSRGLALLARLDPDLHARFLGVASAELGADADADGVAEALGPERASLLLALAAVRRAWEPDPHAAARGDELARGFQHAWMRAVAMHAAAAQLPGARLQPRRAFLAGLFADLGYAALASELSAHGVPWAEATRFAAAEHAAPSAWIAAEWHVPGECVTAAAQHHAPVPLYSAPPALLLLWACEESAAAASGGGDPGALPGAANAARLAGLKADVRFEIERACRDAQTRLGSALAAGRRAPARRVA
jgi:CheY-like chemotaxis protein